jgi:Glycosyl hydrolases family 2, TIM barrel domain/Glycosyl hydrolases family 2
MTRTNASGFLLPMTAMIAMLSACKGSGQSGVGGSGGLPPGGTGGTASVTDGGGRDISGQGGFSATGGVGMAGFSGSAGGGGIAGVAGAVAGTGGNSGGAGNGGAAACNLAVPDVYSTSIAGQWDFTPQGGTATKIQVPGGGWIKQGFTAPSGTYSTTISVPDSGAPQTTLLEFGAINHQATLTLGGTVVATNMTAFTPSVFDVTRLVSPGRQYPISILVRGRDAFVSPAGLRLVPVAANWSANVPQGIFRSAMIRVYPDLYISDVFVRTSVSANSLAYDVWVTNTGMAPRTVTLSGTLDSWNCDPLAYPSIATSSITVAAGATAKATVGPMSWGQGPASYWWPNVPYQEGYQAKLHNLRVSISDAGRVIHTRLLRFGFREAEQRQVDPQHAYYYLNGVRVNFRGDSLQGVDYDSINNGGVGDAYDTLPGFLPPSAMNPGWPQAVRNYQRLNYNVIRIHQELAAPYMLDVADELGQMIIDETAIRGTDGQDFVIGHDNMVNHARALVSRDRNHPSVIRWSQSNEQNLSPTDSIQFATDLYSAIAALDPTRPISADVSGTSHAYDTLVRPNFSVYGHYYSGLGLFSDDPGPRPDRPFGQGEFIWPSDVTRQGFMWFATGTVGMRIKDASEIRPYTLLSAWASVIPGVRTTMMRLEPTYPAGLINPPLFGEDNLPDPWSNPIITRVQRAYNPVLVADQAYWEANKMSNASGSWPVSVDALARNTDVSRSLVIFNDTFAGTSVTVVWEVHADLPTGVIASTGTFTVDVPLGSRITRPITIHTPAAGTTCYLVLRAQKNGVAVFDDPAQMFSLN